MRIKGPWRRDQIERFLGEARVPLRLACNGRLGHPVLVSLWFVELAGQLWCATQRTAHVVSHLERDPRCAFEIAEEKAPYHGVRGQALATLHEDRGESVLRALIDRYLEDPQCELARWLLARAENETAIAIEPRTLVSWDYRERMGNAA